MPAGHLSPREEDRRPDRAREGERCGWSRRRAAAAPVASRARQVQDVLDADRRRSVRRSGRCEGDDRQGVRLRVPVLRARSRDDGSDPPEVRQRRPRRLQAVRRSPAGRDRRCTRVLRRSEAGQGDPDGCAALGQGLQGPQLRQGRDGRRRRGSAEVLGERGRLPGRPRLREGAEPQRGAVQEGHEGLPAAHAEGHARPAAARRRRDAVVLHQRPVPLGRDADRQLRSDHRRRAEEGEREDPVGHAAGEVLRRVGREQGPEDARSSEAVSARRAARDGASVATEPIPERNWVNILWLARLRWAEVAGQAVTVFAAQFSLGGQLPIASLLAVVSVGLVSNLFIEAYFFGGRRGLRARAPIAPVRTVEEWHLALVMMIDIASLTGLLYLTGGPHNPFSFLYLVQIALAAVLVRALWTWTLVGLSFVGFGILILAHQPLAVPEDSRVIGAGVALGVAAAFVVHFLLRITGALLHLLED